MDGLMRYIANIAVLGTMIPVLIALLVATLLRKKHLPITRALIFLTGAMILSLTVQIATSVLKLGGAPDRFGEVPIRVVYIFDYLTGYGIGFGILLYVKELIKAGYQNQGTVFRENPRLPAVTLAVGAFSFVIYSVGLFLPFAYRIEDGAEVTNLPLYILMHLFVKVPEFLALFLLIRHRKVVPVNERILIYSVLFFAVPFVIFDEIHGFGVGYVLLALFVFLLYVRIDVRRSILTERQEKELTELQTQIMLSQMQPHFLYNVLSTVSGMCEMQNALEARDVVNRFADYFRVNMDSLGKNKFIPFEKELEHTKTYLWLEKVRFEDLLNVVYEIGTTDFSVPSLAVQPIVENAVKHGILKKEGAGTLILRTSETPEAFLITVEDDGVGFDPTAEPEDDRTHIGLRNVRERLEILCGGSLEIQSEIGKGTSVSIRIPKKE